MTLMADRKAKAKDEKQSFADKVVEKVYRDSDSYDWSGKMTDKGSDARRKGSDR